MAACALAQAAVSVCKLLAELFYRGYVACAFFTHHPVDKKEKASQLEKELEKAWKQVEKLRRNVHSLEEQVRYHKNKYQQLQEEALQTQIRYFRDRYKAIGRVYYVWVVVDNGKEKYPEQIKLKEVSKLLETEVRGGENHLGSITDHLNQDFDGVLIHLINEFPNIGPADYNLFCYLAAGFDKYLIIELLGLSGKGLYYTRKSRLKEKLLKLRSPHELTYLALINN